MWLSPLGSKVWVHLLGLNFFSYFFNEQGPSSGFAILRPINAVRMDGIATL